MEKLQKTKGLVLSKKNWREDDLLFSILTEDFGKIMAVATGVKKISSKLRGHLASAGIVEILFVQGKSFKKITHAYLIEPIKFENSKDYYLLNVIYEILDKATIEDDYNHGVWELTTWFCKNIVNYENFQQRMFLLNIYLIKLCQIIGFKINVEKTKLGQEVIDLIEQIQNTQQENFKVKKEYNRRLLVFLVRHLQNNLEQKINSLEFINNL